MITDCSALKRAKMVSYSSGNKSEGEREMIIIIFYLIIKRITEVCGQP